MFLSEEIQNVVRTAIWDKARMLKVRIGAIEFGPDHMHVFVIDCKNYSAAKLAEQLKGYSSYVVRRQCWNDVSKKNSGETISGQTVTSTNQWDALRATWFSSISNDSKRNTGKMMTTSTSA